MQYICQAARCEQEPDPSGHVTVLPGHPFIGKLGYSGCNQLRSITFPPELKEIRTSAFFNCRNLEKINGMDSATSNLQKIESGAFYGIGAKSIHIPDSLKYLGDSSFANSQLESVTWGPNIKLDHIGNSTFANTKLRSIHIPDSVKVIGKAAFVNIPSLQSVTWGANSSCKHIKSNAFENDGLINVTLPRSMEQLSVYSFAANRFVIS